MARARHWALLLVCAGTAGAATLSYTLGERGISDLTYDGRQLLKGDGLVVEHAAFRRADGSSYQRPGWDKARWLPRAGDTVSVQQPWGKVACTYRQVGEAVEIAVAVTNTTPDVLTSCEVRLQNLNLPNPAKARYWRFGTDMFWAHDNPNEGHGGWAGDAVTPIVHCDYGAGSLGFVACDQDASVGLQSPGGGYPVFCKLYVGGIAPGETKTRHFALRFGPSGVDPFGGLYDDLLQRFRAARPFVLQWDDRRPVIQEPILANGIPATPRNPRAYQTGHDLRTEAGKRAFRAELLRRADDYVARMRKADAQGVVFWSIEGIEQLNIMYLGDPRRVALAPEMEWRDEQGVATVDAFLRRITDAGFRVGHCVRPQDLRCTPHEFGTVFRPSVHGRLTKVRVRSSFRELRAPHAARLWRNSDNTLVGGPWALTYGGEDAWVELAIPVTALVADTEYTLTVATTETEGAWCSRSMGEDTWRTNGAHLAWRSGSVVGTQLGARPTAGGKENYLRDVVFVPDGGETAENALGALEPTGSYKPIGHVTVDDPAALLIARIGYCVRRWGSSLFYVDSSVDARGQALPAEVFARVQAAFPQVLVMPENQCTGDYACSAPWDEGGHHWVFRTPRKVRALWPGAFTAIHCDPSRNFTPDVVQHYVAGVRQGDILFFQPWDKDTELIESIYAQAGAPPQARLTAPADGATLAPGTTVTLRAEARSRDSRIARVEFHAASVTDGRVKLGEATAPPYELVWRDVPAGRWVLSARAVDAAGLERWPADVVVTVAAAR